MKQSFFNLLLIIGVLLALSSCADEGEMGFDYGPEICSYYVNVSGLGDLTPDNNGYYQLPSNLKCIRKGKNIYKSLCTYEKALSVISEHNHSVNFPPFISNGNHDNSEFSNGPEGLIALGIFTGDGTTVFEWEDGTEDVITVERLTKDRFHRLGFSLTLNGKPVEPIDQPPHTNEFIYVIDLAK